MVTELRALVSATFRTVIVAATALGCSVQAIDAPMVETPRAQLVAADCQPGLAADSRTALWWDSAARMLAGMELQESSPIADRKSAAAHRGQMNTMWTRFNTKRLQPIRDFSQRELGNGPAAISAAAPVFYPFSGPDAAYALAFFPASTDMIFTGLEPVGEVADLDAMDEHTFAASLEQLRGSLRSILALSFFVTMEMDTDLRRNKLSGVTPILMLFLARHGYTVNDIDHVVLNPDGRLCQSDANRVKDVRSTDDRIPGVIVRYQAAGDTRERRIIYFKTDLSNEGLQKRPHYLKFVESVNPPTTMIKSASYLLHLKEFTTLRDHILRHSQAVLQDDTGVPIKLYKQGQWERRLYGSYVGPIPIFQARFQAEMANAYRETAHPLGFGIGYRYESHESNLQLFYRRNDKVVATLPE
jgi:hypothetical protein